MSPTRASPSLDFQACHCGGGTLDKLIQPAILVILAAGPLHGYRLAERIGEMPMFGGQQPDASGIYRFLRLMERKRLVAAAWNLSERGPAKRSYRITAAGRRCLVRWIETLEEYRRGVGQLLRAAR